MLARISSSISTNLVIENITAVWFFTCSLIGNPNSSWRIAARSAGMSQMSNFYGMLMTGSRSFSASESIVTQNDLMPAAAVTSMSMTMSFCTSYCLSIS